MFDAFIEGLFLVLQWKAFSLMMLGMTLGFAAGLLPGIGGAATLALMPVHFQNVARRSLRFSSRDACGGGHHWRHHFGSIWRAG
jgi:TctA family transporter